MKLTRTMLSAAAILALMAAGTFAQTTTPTPAPATAAPATSTATERPMLRQPTMEVEGYTTIATGDITTEDLTGAEAYGSDDKDIGNVDSLALAADGKTVEHIVLEIGGFLGIGAHQVALSPTEVQIMRKGTSSDIRVYVDATKKELQAQPAYKK